MMDWENLRHFAALAAGGSLSAAARVLDVEHATVARRVAALEEQLGIKLVDRRGRRLTLTSDGERIAAIVERMEDESHAIRRAVDGARSELVGMVTISAPPALAATKLAEPLVVLRRSHPGLTIHIVGEARNASLNRGEADIALRLNRPKGGDLTIVKLGVLTFRFYASPSYLATTAPSEWQFIGYDMPMGSAPQQRFLESAAAKKPFVFSSSTVEIQQALARAGGGIAMLPDFLAAKDNGLAAVKIDEQALKRDLWLVTHSDMKGAAPIRAVGNCLKQWFARHELSEQNSDPQPENQDARLPRGYA